MKRKNPSRTGDDSEASKRARSSPLDTSMPRVTAVGCTPFPEAVSHVVGDFLLASEREGVVAALVGVQPTTLCLSQDVSSPHDSCWSLGFLPPEKEWGFTYPEIDKQFPIADVEGCLSFLEQMSSNDCCVVVEVLVVKLRMSTKNSPSALNDLRNTIVELQRHLNNIKNVVISIDKHASCCFTLKNAPDKETGFSPPMYHQLALLQIIDDFEICWSTTHTLAPQTLLAFYFTGGIQRASELYLSKFIISLNDPLNRVLFDKEASRVVTNKIMWVYCLNSFEDFEDFEQDASRMCHAIRLDLPYLKPLQINKLHDRLEHTYSYQNNSSIERIVINSGEYGHYIQLPRPSAPLIDATPFSALVELTLTGGRNTLHLTQLNNGYFPRLAHLTVIDGQISGHLDSDRVPSLKTLTIGVEQDASTTAIVDARIKRHCQAIIHAGRPWQLVATREPGGWSLASYDPPAVDPLNDEKDDPSHSPHSPPLIRELLLVMWNQIHANEFLSQLRGDPSLEAASGDHNDRLLVWLPQCVQKLTANCMGKDLIQLEFKEPIRGQTRILTSLTCHGADLTLIGDVLPRLRSLKLNGGRVMMLGSFVHLEALSFEEGYFRSRLILDTERLQSLSCRKLNGGSRLVLHQQLLPQLSFLKIEPSDCNWVHSPPLLGDNDAWALSRVKHVVFGQDMARSSYFEALRVHDVPHLELEVNALELPACWPNTAWHSEILTIIVHVPLREISSVLGSLSVTVLPLLPRVKKLTVTENNCRVLLDREMSELTECTVTSPRMLGKNLRCPALERIRFTEELSDIEMEQCLDRATYVAIGARPRDVIFAFHYEMHKMVWDVAPSENEMVFFAGH